MRWLISTSWFLCVLLCACDCNGGATKTQRAQQPAPTQAPAAPSAPKSTVASDRLRAFFPDTVAGFIAPEPAKLQVMPLNIGTGTWTVTRRTYEQGPKTLVIEMSDVQHAPGARALIESQQGAKRTAAGQTFRGEPIAGNPALIQWHADNKMSAAAILIHGRVLVTVKVDPSDNDEPAPAIASGLPLDQFAQLVIAASAEERGEPPPASDAPAQAQPSEAVKPAADQPAAKPEAVKP